MAYFKPSRPYIKIEVMREEERVVAVELSGSPPNRPKFGPESRLNPDLVS